MKNELTDSIPIFTDVAVRHNKDIMCMQVIEDGTLFEKELPFAGLEQIKTVDGYNMDDFARNKRTVVRHYKIPEGKTPMMSSMTKEFMADYPNSGSDFFGDQYGLWVDEHSIEKGLVNVLFFQPTVADEKYH